MDELIVLIILLVLSAIFIPKSLASSIMMKLVAGVGLWLWYISFAYYTPDTVKQLYAQYNFNMQSSFDEPTIIFICILAWLLYVTVYYIFITLQRASDIIVAPGVPLPQSCTSANLHKIGDMAWIRAGGTKPIPIEGSTAMFNPLTHIYKIGTHIIFTALCTQKTSITDLPIEIKRHARQQRFDILGVKDCSGGYLTSRELEYHKEIDKIKYKDFLTPIESNDKKPLSTLAFLNSITSWNINYDYQLQAQEHENKSIKEHFQTHTGISKSVQEPEKRSLYDVLFGRGTT
jgi:hypothetical protein